jgi:hypothetical protein
VQFVADNLESTLNVRERFELVRFHIFILYKDLQKSKDSNGRISHQFVKPNWWEACPILWLKLELKQKNLGEKGQLLFEVVLFF